MEKAPEDSPGSADAMKKGLRLSGLPLSVLYDKENFEKKVKELICGTFSLPDDAVEGVTKMSVTKDDQEVGKDVLVTFRSRVHRNRVYSGRSRLESPIVVTVDSSNTQANGSVSAAGEGGSKDHDKSDGSQAKTEQKEETEKKVETPKVRKRPSSLPQDDDEFMQLQLDYGEEDDQEERNQNESPSGNVEDERGIIAEDRGKNLEETEESSRSKDEAMEVEEEDGEESEEHEKSDGEGADGEKGKNKFSMVWEGAPEFQWKTTGSAKDDHRKLIVDNISVGDLTNPFLYQSMMRAEMINFNFLNNTIKGHFDNHVLVKGRLTMQFMNDVQAMAQAVNGLVFLRTASHRQRLKIYLPQTGPTIKMKHLLEMKLGRVIEPHLKSRQLLIRDVGADVSEQDVRSAFERRGSSIDQVEFVQDILERRCVVLTFEDAESAILSHIDKDQVTLGEMLKDDKRRHAKVFFMEDIVEGSFVLKPEMRYAQRQRRDKYESGSRRRSRDRGTEEEKKRSLEKSRSPERKRSRAESAPKRKSTPSMERDKPSVYFGGTRGASKSSTYSSSPYRGSRGRSSFRAGRGGRSPRTRPRSRSPPRRSLDRGVSRGLDRGTPRSSRGFRGRDYERRGGSLLGVASPSTGHNVEHLSSILVEQQKQIEYQQQLLKQQEIINELADQLARKKSTPSEPSYSGTPPAQSYSRSTPTSYDSSQPILSRSSGGYGPGASQPSYGRTYGRSPPPPTSSLGLGRSSDSRSSYSSYARRY